MMNDQWTERLSEYLDDELPPGERAALEAHLRGCVSCRTTLAQLERVVARARALDDRAPTTDLWPTVARRIGLVGGAPAPRVRVPRRIAFTVPQLAAAALALALCSSAGAWLLLGRRAPGAGATAAGSGPGPNPALVSTATYPTDQRYAAQVADLERALARGRGQLDTGTVRVIEKNLAIIDRAIRDAQSALAADPANSYLNLHLAREKRRKLELLRRAAVLAGAQS
jgi:anti-sigma factor RsiW